jgi:hypothetical protein
MDEGQNRNGGMSGGIFSSLDNDNSGTQPVNSTQSAGNMPSGVGGAQPTVGNTSTGMAGGTGFSSFSNNTHSFGSGMGATGVSSSIGASGIGSGISSSGMGSAGFGSNMSATGLGASGTGMISSTPDVVAVGSGDGDGKKSKKLMAIVGALVVIGLIVGVSVYALTRGGENGGGQSGNNNTGDNSGNNNTGGDDNGDEDATIGEKNTDYKSLLIYGPDKSYSIDNTSNSYAWYFYGLMVNGTIYDNDADYLVSLKEKYDDYWKDDNSDTYKKYNQYFSLYYCFANRNEIMSTINGLDEMKKEEFLDSLLNLDNYYSYLYDMAVAEKQFLLNGERINAIYGYLDSTWDEFVEMTNALEVKLGGRDE